MDRTSVSLHHITWVVRDLAVALASLSPVLPADAVVHESLPQRGVATARVRVGTTWLVFVQPLGPGAPADRLARAGEGPLLLSLGVTSLDAALDDAVARGARPTGPARTGVGGWKVVDLDVQLPGGASIQLCEDPAAADDG